MANSNSIIKQIIQFEASLTKESKATVKKQIEDIFTSAQTSIAIDPKSAQQSFTAIATMMNNIFKTVGTPTIDIYKMLNENDIHSAFTVLGQMASKDFMTAWTKMQQSFPSLNQNFIRERSDLTSAYQRMLQGNKEIKTTSVQQIEKALQPSRDRSRTNINTLLSELVSAKDIITNDSYSWEAQDVARLNYIKLRDQIMKRTEGGSDLSGVQSEYMDIVKQIDQIGVQTISQLRAAIPAIQTSLQNIFTLAAGKTPLNLTKAGVYDVAQSPQGITELNTWGLVGARGKLAQPVVKDIYEGVDSAGGKTVLTANEVVKAFEELKRLSTDPSQIQTAEQLNDIYEERKRIIQEIGSANLQTADPVQYAHEKQLQMKYKNALKQQLQKEADIEIFNKLNELKYNEGSQQDLNKLIVDRQALMSGINDKSVEAYKHAEEENAQIVKQINLMKQAAQASTELTHAKQQAEVSDDKEIKQLQSSIKQMQQIKQQVVTSAGVDIKEVLKTYDDNKKHNALVASAAQYGKIAQNGKQIDVDNAILKYQNTYNALVELGYTHVDMDNLKPQFTPEQLDAAWGRVQERFKTMDTNIAVWTERLNKLQPQPSEETPITEPPKKSKNKKTPKQTDADVGDSVQESKDLQDVQAKVEAITKAVNLKTDAFRNEGVEVARIVTEEIAELTKLEEIVNRIVEKVNAIVAGIGNIQINEPKLDNVQKEAGYQQKSSFKQLQSLERQYGRYKLLESVTFGAEKQRVAYEKSLIEPKITEARKQLDPKQIAELDNARSEGREKARLAEVKKLQAEVQKLGELEAKADTDGLASSQKRALAMSRQVELRKKALGLTQKEYKNLYVLQDNAYQSISEPRANKEHENAVKLLIKLYEQLGKVRMQALTADANSQSKLNERENDIKQQISDIMKGETFTKEEKNKFVSAQQNGSEVAREKALQKLQADSVKLGRLQAQQLQQKAKSRTQEVRELGDSIKERVKILNLTKQEIDLIKNANKEEVKRVTEKYNIKAQQQANRFNKSVSLADKAQGIYQNVVDIEGVGAENVAKDLQTRIQNLEGIIHDIRINDINDDTYTNLKTQTAELDKHLAKVSQYIRLSSPNTEVMGTSPFKDISNPQAIESALKEQVMLYTNGAAKIKGYDAATGQLSYTIKEAGGYVASYTAEVRDLDRKMVAARGTVTKTEGVFATSMRKMKEFSSYFTGSTIIYKSIEMIKEGVTYVKEIDAALTELKKVTNETTETYDKFLETAGRTASKVGSTIKDITSSAADWARLGYSISEAAQLAETTQVLMNVSEFTDVSTATDSLISSIQAFKYTAEESMDVVDILNTIGNNYAISTADLATSLTKSSGSLVAANGTLEEAVALTATANTIIQDADVVGTALKTVAMRLRGTSTEVMEAEGVDTDGAVTSKSKLRGQIKGLSGVDILTQTGEYKSTYEILSEISKVWKDISDVDQAALLELLAGKRAGSVMSAILNNPDILANAFESANNATGSAWKENETYLESIQGRLDLLSNEFQTMWNNAISDEFIKWVIDAGTGLTKLVDKVGLLKSLFLTISTLVVKSKYGGDFRAMFGLSAPKDIDSYISKIQNVANGEHLLSNTKWLQYDKSKGFLGLFDKKNYQRTKFQDVIKPYLPEIEAEYKQYQQYQEELTDLQTRQSKLKEKKATNGVLDSFEQDELTQLPDKISKVEHEIVDSANKINKIGNVVTKNQLQNGIKIATASEKLKTDFKEYVKSAGTMLIISSAIELVYKGVEALVSLGKSDAWEGAHKEFEEMSAELESTTGKISNLNSELTTVNSSIEELEAQPSLSFVEQEELDKLRDQSRELENQIDLLEELQKSQKKMVSTAALNASGAYLGEDFYDYSDEQAALQSDLGILSSLSTIAGAGVGLLLENPQLGAIIGSGLGNMATSSVPKMVYDSPTVEGVLSNLDSEKTLLEYKEKNAQEAYNASPDSKILKERWQEAQKALSDYHSSLMEVSNQLQTYLNSVDYSQLEDDQKQEYIDALDNLNKINISEGGSSAINTALESMFFNDDVITEEAKDFKTKLNAALAMDDDLTYSEAVNLNLDDTTLKRLDELGVSLVDVIEKFKDMQEEEEKALSYKPYDMVEEVAKVTSGVEALKSAFEEFNEVGVVSAATLAELSTTFGKFDAWDNFVETMTTGVATTKEAEQAINELVEDLTSNMLKGNPIALIDEEGNRDLTTYLTLMSQLQSLGVENAYEYVNALQQQAATQKVIADMNADQAKVDLLEEKEALTEEEKKQKEELEAKLNNQQAYVDAVEKEYGFKIDNTDLITQQKELDSVEDKLKDVQKLSEQFGGNDDIVKQCVKLSEELATLNDMTMSEIAEGVDYFKIGSALYAHEDRKSQVMLDRGELVDVVKQTASDYGINIADLDLFTDKGVQDAVARIKPVLETDKQELEKQKEELEGEIEKQFDNLGVEVELELLNADKQVDDIQNVFDTLAGAQKEYREEGYFSVDTLQSLLNLEPKYLALLFDENGRLNLNKETLYEVAVARLTDMKLKQQNAVLEEAEKLAKEGTIDALYTQISATYGLSEAYDVMIAKRLQSIKTILTERQALAAGTKGALDSSFDVDGYISSVQHQLNAVDWATTNSIKNIRNSLSAAGNTAKQEAEDAFQKAMDYWENRIGANQSRFEQIQNEIDLIEEKGKVAGDEYYKEQIKLENERLALLNKQKAAANSFLGSFKEGSDEWFYKARLSGN